MPLVTLFVIAVLCFAATAICRHLSDSKTLISVAIGCAINSNIFNSVSMPIAYGGLVFGIDSALYTLFMFTVVVKAKDYSVREAKDLTISTIIAILVSAFIELFAKWSFAGMSLAVVLSFASYVLSSVGTFLGVWAMLWCFELFSAKRVNTFLTFAVAVMIASLINSTVYFGGAALVKGDFANILSPALTGSYLGKLVSIGLGLLGYLVNQTLLKPGESLRAWRQRRQPQ